MPKHNQAEAEGIGKERKPSPKPVITDGDEAGDSEWGRAAGKIEPRPAVWTAIATSEGWEKKLGDRSASPPDSSLIWGSSGHSGWI